MKIHRHSSWVLFLFEHAVVPLADFVLDCHSLRRPFGFLDNSARTAEAIFAVSILYRAAAHARFESFASDCLGL